MAKEKIWLSSPTMHTEELAYIREAFDKNWVAPLGFNCDGFEEETVDYLKSKGGAGDLYALSLCSGTAALHLAVKLAGVQSGDTVFCSDMTFSATVNPVSYEGGRQVFIDAEPETWNMDPAALERAFEKYPNTKLVIMAHLYGTPGKMAELTAICEKHGAILIEDAAEALSATYRDRACGSFGDYGVLSYNGNKIITTSGGGMLLTHTEEDYNKAFFWATQAREATPWYQHEEIGYNYRMSNVCAGIGRGQMTVVDDHIEHHKHVQEMYVELLADVPGITVHQAPKHPEDGEKPVFDSNYWLCTITLDPSLRIWGQENVYGKTETKVVGGAAGVLHASGELTTDCQPNDNVEALRVWLDREQIEARPLWKPMHKQPVYKNAPAYVNGVSESLFKVGLCLPSGPWVSPEDVTFIVDAIKRAIVS